MDNRQEFDAQARGSEDRDEQSSTAEARRRVRSYIYSAEEYTPDVCLKLRQMRRNPPALRFVELCNTHL